MLLTTWFMIGLGVTAARLLSYAFFAREKVARIFSNAVVSTKGYPWRTAAGVAFCLICLAVSVVVWPLGLVDILYFGLPQKRQQ